MSLLLVLILSATENAQLNLGVEYILSIEQFLSWCPETGYFNRTVPDGLSFYYRTEWLGSVCGIIMVIPDSSKTLRI